jgi:hypothetical protein
MNVSVDLGDGKIIQMDDKYLERRDIKTENDHETTRATEYWFMGRQVHRSVHVHLKHGIGIEGVLGRVG